MLLPDPIRELPTLGGTVLVRRLLVVLLALLGVAALAVGVGLRTVWLPEDVVRAALSVDEAVPLLVTAPGVLEARPGPVTVEASSDGDTPLLLAVGREHDVEAWVGDAAHTTVTGFAGDAALTSETTEGEVEVPDPAGSDLWVQTVAGEGTVTLEYEAPDGRFLLLAAADGATPAPGQLTLTWPREVTTPWSLPLTVLGALLLLAALALLVASRRRARTSRTPAPEPRRHGVSP